MLYFIWSILLLFCIAMFFIKRKYKLAIMMFSSICFGIINIDFIPFGYANHLIPISFLFSEIKNWNHHFIKIKSTILQPLTIAMLCATVILLINSPHYNENIIQGARLFVLEIITKYLVILYSFICINKEEDLKLTLHITFWGMLILTIFGIINYITRQAVFVNVMMAGEKLNDVSMDMGRKFLYADRFRVQAMFFNPFDYGYICIIMLILHIYGYERRITHKLHLWIILVCSLFGIFTCGSRAILLCAMLGIGSYFLLSSDLKNTIKKILILIIISFSVYSFVPYVNTIVHNMTTIFNTNSKMEGSSIQMRTYQYAAVMYHIRDHILFGQGKDFFKIDLGWDEGKSALLDKDLMGLEGILMNILLERGVIGTIFYILFYISLLFFLYKNRSLNKKLSSFGIAILSIYLVFANSTGELLSVYPTLLIIGFVIRMIYNTKTANNKIYKH